MDLRNIAIIAHVDHGKTTLVDRLLQQSGTFRENQYVPDQALDSHEIERERGITILAKCTSVLWKGTRINIVDTPGHADFGGEVERILGMVDSCLLLVDAAEGPMPQTKFVLGKALKRGLRPIVVVNKVDKPDQRAQDVLNEVFDLFVALDANEQQLDFPYLFASAKQGWAIERLDEPRVDMTPLFERIVAHTPPPAVDPEGPFRLLVSILEADPYLGRILTGRIESGRIRPGATIKALSRDGRPLETARVTKVLAFRGLSRQPIEEGTAGDIVAIAGFERATVADTLCDPVIEEPLPAQPIDPPVIAMTFRVNDGPFAGRDGTKVTSRQIWERLVREAEGNVAIRVKPSTERDAFEVEGRGELQMAILIEQMRREGFELCVGRPRVLLREDPETGRKLEPVEEVVIDLDEEFAGVVVEKLSRRKAELLEMKPSGAGKLRLVFKAPARALIGYFGEFLTDTRGTGVMNRVFAGYEPWKGPIQQRHNGVLVSTEQGTAVAYALWYLQERGPLFVSPGDEVYCGMIIGEHSRDNDLEVNPLREKKLTNIRAAGKDDNILLTPPVPMTLERAIAYIAEDELVEVTPKAIRLRKRLLDPHARRRAARQKELA
ncbi:MAG: translational GTPase TypA [Geminicoccaceae bacterium]|nr:translational GTPase TypA [Geminicoccaceae bacterium]MCX7629151.1 translational GTPase TypA [Geminicoccaceae bacterium]